MISQLRENVLTSAVGYVTCGDNDNKKSFHLKNFSYLFYFQLYVFFLCNSCLLDNLLKEHGPFRWLY